MAEYYKIVSDENETKWFYDHMLRDLKPGEAWMMCLGARDKKLSEEEKEKIIDDWCSHKAYALFKKDMSREEKQTIKALFRKQLFVTDRPRYN